MDKIKKAVWIVSCDVKCDAFSEYCWHEGEFCEFLKVETKMVIDTDRDSQGQVK